MRSSKILRNHLGIIIPFDNEIDGQNVFIDRIWELEVRPSFFSDFCLGVYEGPNSSLLAVAFNRFCFHRYACENSEQIMGDMKEEIKNISLDDLDRYWKEMKEKPRENRDDYVFYYLLLQNNSWLQKLEEGLVCHNLLQQPARQENDGIITLLHDGTGYRFDLDIHHHKMSLNFNSIFEEQYKELLCGFAQVANILAGVCNDDKVESNLKEWIHLINLKN